MHHALIVGGRINTYLDTLAVDSNTASVLLNLQVGGTSKVNIDNSGITTWTGAQPITFRNDSGNAQIRMSDGQKLSIMNTGGTHSVSIGSNSAHVKFGGGENPGLLRIENGVLRISDGDTGGGSFEFLEQTAPAAGAANTARIYAVDTGGKTEILAKFSDGSTAQICIQP